MATNFTRTTRTHSLADDTFTVVETTIEGVAIRTPGDPILYRELGLVEAEAPTLLWVPATYGDTPEPGDTVTWNGLGYTVRHVDPLAPDGVVIQARVVIAR